MSRYPVSRYNECPECRGTGITTLDPIGTPWYLRVGTAIQCACWINGHRGLLWPEYHAADEPLERHSGWRLTPILASDGAAPDWLVRMAQEAEASASEQRAHMLDQERIPEAIR